MASPGGKKGGSFPQTGKFAKDREQRRPQQATKLIVEENSNFR